MASRLFPALRAGLRATSFKQSSCFRSKHTLGHHGGDTVSRFRWGPTTALVLGTTAATTLYISQVIRADEVDTDDTAAVTRKPVPLTDLIRAYAVYSMCAVPSLVDNAPFMLSTLASIPGIKQLTEVVVRHTFFAQVRGQLLLACLGIPNLCNGLVCGRRYGPRYPSTAQGFTARG
jgi:hypothetical protein